MPPPTLRPTSLTRTLLLSTRPISHTQTHIRTFLQRPQQPIGFHPQARSFTSTPHPRAENDSAKKSAVLDREKLDPEADEYSGSGTDDAAAKNEQAAFDPNITSPEGAKDKAGEGNEGNPLEVSPANQDVSQGTAEEEGGAKKKVSEGGGGRS